MSALNDLTAVQRWTFAAIFIVAAAMRIALDDVSEFSRADESVYACYTQTLVSRGFVTGYREIVQAYETDERRWVYPSPLRWGYFALSTTAAAIQRSASPHALATLSTIAGIAVVPAIFLFALELFGANVALLAAAFTAVSCIELALGRRALQDEVFCLSVLVTLYFFVMAVSRDRFLTAAIASMMLSFAIKESFLYLVPAFVAVFLVYRRPREVRVQHLLLFALPPLIYYAGFSVLARSATAFFRVGGIVTSTLSAPYVVQYQGGPPHRLLVDFFVTAPLVSILAAAAIVFIALRPKRRDHVAAVALFVIVAVAAFAIVPSKNLRFYVMLDPMIRLLAAWVVASAAVAGRAASGSIVAVVAAANAAIELELFHRIFIVHGVYDPVTQTLLQALAALPRGESGPEPQLLFPAVCALLVAIWWMWPRPSTDVRAGSS